MKLKDEKGITLIALVMYMIASMLALAILASITNFMYQNIGTIRSSARFASEFDEFNYNIVKDTWEFNYVETITQGNQTIIYLGNEFTNKDNTVNSDKHIVKYTYDSTKQTIIREDTREASNNRTILEVSKNVLNFVPTIKTVTTENFSKQYIEIYIVIGTEGERSAFSRTMKYFPRYWNRYQFD
jgi:hypothetical protein